MGHKCKGKMEKAPAGYSEFSVKCLKTTDVDLGNITFLETTVISLLTISLQLCAEKGKLAPTGAKEAVTTPNMVNL